MADEKKMKQAEAMYKLVCEMLEHKEWKFARHDEDLTITCGVRGDDLPMDIVIVVNPDSQVVSLYSPLPFRVKEEKRVDAAVAVCVANYGLINGAFDYDISDGEIRFRVVSSYRESILSEQLLHYMLVIAVNTVDDYNDKFLMLSKGVVTLQQFIDADREPKED